MRRALLLAVVAVLALPAVAPAHSIIRVRGTDVSYTSSDATSTNSLTIRATATEIEFSDPTVDGGIDYGTCRPGATNTEGYVVQAFCARSGITQLRVDVGEREDVVALGVDLPMQGLGGAGADEVTGANGSDVLVGGDGNDELRALGGNDNVLAGSGDDLVETGDGNDQIQAGAGYDVLDAGAGDDDVKVRDGLKDRVACGPGTDTVDADALDELAGDCENVTRAATAGGTLPATSSEPPPDKTAPRLRAGALTRQRLGALRVLATSSEAGSVAASGFLDVAGLRFPLKTVRAPIAVDGAGATLVLKPGRALLRRARRALRHGKRVSARIGVVATDAAGNSIERRAPLIRVTG